MGENNPTVSVILPTRNRAALVGRAIRSVLAQTYEDFELLVVDDASSDETREVVESFSDRRLVYIRRDSQNSGASAARNTGIIRARGTFISFLDDDDEYLPQFLAETVRAFEAAPEQVGFVWCGVQLVQDTPQGEIHLRQKLWQPRCSAGEQPRGSFFRSGVLVGTGDGLTVRATCFKTIGVFDEAFKALGDTDLLIRLATHFDFSVIPAMLVKRHRHNGAQLTDPTLQRAEAVERIIQKHIDLLYQYPDLWIDFHFKAGSLYYRAGDRERGRQWMLKVIQKAPFHLRTWLRIMRFELFGAQPLLHPQKPL